MCRLFAAIAPGPRGSADLLVDSDFSLLRQSNFKRTNQQRDGWGIGWFGNNGEPRVSKSPGPAYREAAEFRRAAESAVSRIVIGHIRAASNPMGLSKAKLLTAENAQPFTDGRWLFAHNGTLNIPREVAERLGPLRRRLRSENDSEVYFWHLLKHLSRGLEPARAVQEALLELWDVWDRCKERHYHKGGPYTSLNALLSDGRSLHAVCHAIRRGLSSCGVCTPDQPWSLMSFGRRGRRLVVCSEPVDRGGWTAFSPPEVLSAAVAGSRVELSRHRLAGVPQSGLAADAAVAEAAR